MVYSIPKDTASRPVVVVGSGALGRRVGLVWASQGGSVILADTNPQAAAAALAWIKEELPDRVKCINGGVGEVTIALDIEIAVKGAWMVVECISEIKDAKVSLLGQLDEFCDSDTIVATISSSYKSGDLLDMVSDEGKVRVLNTHYFRPPELPPVEIMSSGHTDPAIIHLLIAKLRDIGLDPVVVKKQSTGFLFGRIWAALKREVMMALADEVGTPEDIDKLFRYTFKSEGAPCALMDNIGLQTVCDIEDHYVEERGNLPTYHVDYLRRNYVDNGDLGVITGKGLYDYRTPETENHTQK